MTAPEVRTWVGQHVPEADTPDKAAALAAGLELVGYMMLRENLPVESQPMRASRINRESEAVVEAWDRLVDALRGHSTFLVDYRRANGGQCLDTLRAIIDQYRTPLPVGKMKRTPGHNIDVLVQAVGQVRELLSVSENRGAEIVAAFAQVRGVVISGPSLRQAARNRRL